MKLSVCRRRRSGSMQYGTGAPRSTISATMSHNCAGMPIMRTPIRNLTGATNLVLTVWASVLLWWVVPSRTVLVCMTCTATCGSGWRIVITIVTWAPRQMVVPGCKGTAAGAWFGAAPGMMIRRTYVPPTVEDLPAPPVMTAGASAWPRTSEPETTFHYSLRAAIQYDTRI